MNKTAEIIQFDEKKTVDYEDIICVLNPIQACDLKQILLMTHADRRISVALAFADITNEELFEQSGFGEHNRHAYRWISGKNRLPAGAAFRLAKVFGVPAEILFQSPKYRGEHDH